MANLKGICPKSKRRVHHFQRNVIKLGSLLMLSILTFSLSKLSMYRRPIYIDVPLEWIDQFKDEQLLVKENWDNHNVGIRSVNSKKSFIRNKGAKLLHNSSSPRRQTKNPIAKSHENDLNFYFDEEQLEIDYEHESSEESIMELENCLVDFPKIPPNPNFIFHNKLPKSGSSTMNNILKVLRRNNSFNFLKVDSGLTALFDRRPLVDFLQNKIRAPYLLLKHHYWFNFTEYDMEQPTFINVIRDPIEWFTSRYYFSRYGWKRKPGCRTQHCGMSKEEFEMDIDECVAKRHLQCISPWMYIPFFCGANRDCFDITSMAQKRKSLEIAKKRIVNDYYLVGILEQFEDTLQVLEKTLPSYFKGAVEVWKGKFVQQMQELTKTTFKKTMSEESRKFFMEGPLKYEIELYNFARRFFNMRMKALGVKFNRK